MFDRLLAEIQRRLEQLAAVVLRLEQRMAAAEQSTAKVWGNMPPQGGGGGSLDIFQCVAPASGGPWTATGTYPYTPASFVAATVYTLDASPTSVATSATVYYHSTVALAVSAMVLVKKNSDGTYSVVNKVC